MDHDSVVDDWRQNAERNDEESYEFLRSMKFRDYGFDPDELAGELHKQAFQIVDCTRCANCCKTMDVKFDDEDIERIAEHLNTPTAEFIETHWKPKKRTARTRLTRSRARFSAMTTAAQSTMWGLPYAENTRTLIKKASRSGPWALPTTPCRVPLCSWNVEQIKKQSEAHRRKKRRRRRL